MWCYGWLGTSGSGATTRDDPPRNSWLSGEGSKGGEAWEGGDRCRDRTEHATIRRDETQLVLPRLGITAQQLAQVEVSRAHLYSARYASRGNTVRALCVRSACTRLARPSSYTTQTRPSLPLPYIPIPCTQGSAPTSLAPHAVSARRSTKRSESCSLLVVERRRIRSFGRGWSPSHDPSLSLERRDRSSSRVT